MTEKAGASSNPVADISAWLRPTTEEIHNLQRIEREGDSDAFVRARRALDHKYESRQLIDFPGLAGAALRRSGLEPIVEPLLRQYAPVATTSSMLVKLVTDQDVQCSHLIPFQFSSAKVTGDATGADSYETKNGILGVTGDYSGDYGLTHPGEPSGTTRTSRAGSIVIDFTADLPNPGLTTYYLMMPHGMLHISGSTRVVGHGNSSTSYDAKTWLEYGTILFVPGSAMEVSSSTIHYDGTRSEDRTKSFVEQVVFPQRHVHFTVTGPTTLHLNIWLLLRCEANQDGLATIVLKAFGFASNETWDHDSIVVKG